MSIAVAHLARKANGIEPFRRFVESYDDVDAGAEHDLVLLLKGFAGDGDDTPYRELAPSAQTVHLPDTGLDLGSYSAAAHVLDHDRVCFLNSFTTLRVDGWLGKLDAALDEPAVGLAGASGSWGSHWSWLLYELGLPNVYARVFPSRQEARAALIRIAESREVTVRARGTAVAAVGALVRIPFFAGRFDAFPAPHLRTNAFLVGRDTMRSWPVGRIRGKWDAFALESGHRSLTQHVESRGRRAVVVGADGGAYAAEEWPDSDTFWQREQSNLLVADNQTEQYTQGDAQLRGFLSRFAWAERAEPGT